MKERMPFTLDMDLLAEEAKRAGMSISKWSGDPSAVDQDSVVNIVTDVSDYIHPTSIASHLVLLIHKELDTNDVVLISSSTSYVDLGISRISVTVIKSTKEK